MPSEEIISLFIVEDDANIRYLLEVAAQRAGGFDPVRVAPDGQAAWEMLQQTDAPSLPDLIITDLSMPRLNGLDLVRRLKADAHLHSIPVAILTSSNQAHDREDALLAGACAFFPKPQGLEALRRVLAELRDTCAHRVHA